MKEEVNKSLSIGIVQLLGFFSIVTLMVSFWGAQHIILTKMGKTPFTFIESLIIYITFLLHLAVFSTIAARNKESNN